MARVPVFDQMPGQGAVRQGRAASPASGEAMGLQGRQLADVGQSLGQAARIGGEVAARKAEEVNTRLLQDAYNRAILEAQALKNEYSALDAAETLKGDKPMSAAYTERLREKMARIGGEFASPALKERWGEMAARMETSFTQEAMAHEAVQYERWAQNVNDATVVRAFGLIAADPLSPATVDAQTKDARAALEDKFRRAGYAEGSGLEEQVAAAMGQAHHTVINQLLTAGDTDGAKAYFAKTEDDFLAADAEMVRASLTKAASAAQALDDVDSLLADMPLRGEAPRVATLDAALRERYADDPARLDLARAELRYRVGLHKEEWAANYASAMNTVARAAMEGGMSPGELAKLPAFGVLKPEDQARFRQMTAPNMEAEFDLNRVFFMHTQAGLDQLASMSDEEAFGVVAGKVGPKYFDDVMKARQAEIAARAESRQVQISQDTADNVFLEFKITRKKDQVKALAYMQRAIRDKEKELGRPIRNQIDQIDLLRPLMARKIIVPGTFGVRETPVWQIAPEDIRDLRIPGDARAPLSEMMRAEMAGYQVGPMAGEYGTEARRESMRPTDGNMLRRYLEMHGVDTAAVPAAELDGARVWMMERRAQIEAVRDLTPAEAATLDPANEDMALMWYYRVFVMDEEPFDSPHQDTTSDKVIERLLFEMRRSPFGAAASFDAQSVSLDTNAAARARDQLRDRAVEAIRREAYTPARERDQ